MSTCLLPFCHLEFFVNRLVQCFLLRKAPKCSNMFLTLELEFFDAITDLTSGYSQKIGGGNFSLPYLLKICQQFHEKWDIEVRKTILGILQNFQIEMLLRH